MTLFVSSSRLHGHGVFTDTFIPRGTEIPNMRPNPTGFNWSQSPNIQLLKHSRGYWRFVALRNIDAGEELTLPHYADNTVGTGEIFEGRNGEIYL